MSTGSAKTIYQLFILLIWVSVISAQESNYQIKRTYYDSGKLKTEGTYLNAVKNGIYREFYESGQVWKEWYFKDGNEDGI